MTERLTWDDKIAQRETRKDKKRTEGKEEMLDYHHDSISIKEKPVSPRPEALWLA